MTVSIAIESPLQDDVRDLIGALNDYLLPTSPLEFQFKMTVEQMAEPDTTVFIARNGEGKAVGCGALKVHEGGVGEVKRMFTLPEMRGQKVGAQILAAVVALGRDKGLERLVLETGAGAFFDSAVKLYVNGGFSECGVVLDYPESEWSRFFEMHLEREAA